MLGERGGQTISLEFAQTLHSIYKDDWRRIIREGVAEVLSRKDDFHCDDLRPLSIPPDHKPVIGTVISTLVRQGKIVEVGRRRSVAPERHGAKSGVYHLTDLGRHKLAEHLGARQEGSATEVDPVGASPSLSPTGSLRLFDGGGQPPVTSHYRDAA